MADKNYSNIPLELKLKLKKIIDRDFNKNNNLRKEKILELKKIEEEKATKKFKREKDLFITDKQASEGNPGDKELGNPVKPIK
jgi:hypothetical protein